MAPTSLAPGEPVGHGQRVNMASHNNGDSIANRKDHHIDICLDEEVGSGSSTGLGGYRLEYDALPEVDLQAVDLRCTVLGKQLQAPLVVGAMTGGTERAKALNKRLAQAAARVGVGMALGSQRAMLKNQELSATFVVRDVAPDLPLLFANIGAVQLNYGVDAKDVNMLAESVQADAVNFHLNALQEAIQPEGDTRFAHLHDRLQSILADVSLPCVAKEVGAGIGPRAAAKLAALDFDGVEAAGVGGTSWARVESYRAASQSIQARVGQRLAGFGIPTADSVLACRKAFGDRLVVASGGVRTGMDVAVALALGADVAAYARPLLVAAEKSVEAVVHELETMIYELRVVCFCVGARSLEELRSIPVTKVAHRGVS